MWKVEYSNNRYYLVNSETNEKKVVPDLTQREIETKRYQQYYDKAYVMCQYLNGQTVYHTRHIGRKSFMYKMQKRT